MMTRLSANLFKALQPILLAAAIMLGGPLFAIIDQAFSDTALQSAITPAVLKSVPTRMTVIYKSDFLGT
jgi:hypothetical protein